MAFFLLFFFWIASTVIGELLRPKPKFGTPTPSSLGDFQVPTAEEGRAVPVPFGTVKIAGPNVVWYGDFAAVPIKQKVKTGLFSSKKVTTGYKYYLGAQLVLGHGVIDELVELRFDDRPVPFTLAPGYYRPIEPSDSSWGQTGFAPAASCIDDVYPDGDRTFCQGSPPGSGAVIGLRFNLGNPTSQQLSGWKLHVVAKRVLTGTVPTDQITVYNQTLWGTGLPGHVTWIGGNTVRTSSSPFCSNLLTANYQDFVLEFTEAEALQLRTSGAVSVLITSNGFSGSGSAVEQITQVYLEVPGSINNEPCRIHVEQPGLFGGDEGGGGIVGDFDFYRGSLTQTANDYLQARVGAALPGYRGVSYIVARGVYVGTSSYLKFPAYVVRRCPNQLGATGGAENIGGDANPACMLYEILTDARWGLGIGSAQIDAGTFLAAAATLAAESFGLSMLVDSGASGADLMNEVLRHIDGVLVADPQTGLIRLKLARADYSPTDLPRYDQDFGVASCKLSRPSWDETKNVAKVSYIDRAGNFTERIAQAQDLASVQARGGEVSSEEYPFRGISNAALAQRVAARTLKTTTYPLAPLELRMTRVAWRLRPGDVFRLTWAPLGIADMVVRVLRIHTGELRDGMLRVDVVEDIFAIAWTAYSAPGSTGWVDPVAAVGSLLDPRLVEVPYALVVGADRLAMALAGNGSPAATGYEAWSDPDGGTDYARTADVVGLTPVGTLAGSAASGDVGYTDSFLRVTAGPGMTALSSPSAGDFAAGSAVCMIDDELIAWADVSVDLDGTYVLSGCVRGVMDTTPARHLGGARVYFVTDGAGLVSGSPYATDFTLHAKLLARNALGTQALAAVSDLSLVLNSRAQRPYVPTAVIVNAATYPTLISGALTIAWSHRNRLGTWSFNDAGVTASPEATTTYTLRLYDNNDVLRRTYSGITGTSQAWATEDADSGLGAGVLNSRIRFELEAVVGALASYQLVNLVAYRTIESEVPGPLATSRREVIRRSRKRRGRARPGTVWSDSDGS